MSPERKSRSSKTDLGHTAEDAVAARLQTEGFRLIARNYSVHGVGELDLICLKQQVIHVVEVKARNQTDGFGGPLAAITPAKLGKIRKTTLHFLQKYHLLNSEVTFLAADVRLNDYGKILSINLVPIEMF